MNLTKVLGVSLLAVLLGACATQSQPPIALQMEKLSSGANRVAIQFNEVPETNTTFPGAGCLLCIGIARGAHSDMSTQIQSLTPVGLETLPEQVAEVLQANGAIVSMVHKKVDLTDLADFTGDIPGRRVADKDFRSLAAKLNADKLLVIDITGQGVSRSYSLYVPTDIPRAYVLGSAYMIDLKSNAYDWFWPLSIYTAAQGEWKEPPSFPGLTNAYFQTIDQTMDKVVANLTAPQPVTPSENPGKVSAAQKQ